MISNFSSKVEMQSLLNKFMEDIEVNPNIPGMLQSVVALKRWDLLEVI